jgi:hypothetical protein
MLDRPADRRTAVRRSARRQRQRRYEQRQRRGVGVYTVELDAPTVGVLIALGWLPEGAEGDRRKVGAAISAALRELADWHRR